MAALVVEEEAAVAPLSVERSALALMSGQGTGTALWATVALITLLAAPAASNVGLSKRNHWVVGLKLTYLAQDFSALGVEVVLAVAVAVAAAAALAGNLGTGSAPGLDATSTILQAAWNASAAAHQGMRVAKLHFDPPGSASLLYDRRRTREPSQLVADEAMIPHFLAPRMPPDTLLISFLYFF
ncbi:hypothetical protein AKJ16_DCAP21398 [Drosera capensis]